MIHRLLIANRGEIARRIARTCREMGIETVAIYSDADSETPLVSESDLSLRVGPASARDSYLNAEAVLLLAEGNGCDAIHPGYGFLSENAEFSEACQACGIAFVGPPPEAIRAMGDKAKAKQLMTEAEVPVLPGYSSEAIPAGSGNGDPHPPERLLAEAERIGYPLLVKAIAGGGGRGIRRVDSPQELVEAAASARREAEAAFGDGRLMLEKYLIAPRHVEFQIMADCHGHTVHLYERECSVQRRHQKIIEEAPSPALDSELRAEMGVAAVKAAQAVGYVGAGTVEFLLDGDGNYYFLEMNTRLQVEHPVTEMILGLDLVRLQIELAEGQPLEIEPGSLRPHGHAIECRLNAEDPARGFLPATGTLRRFEFTEGPGLRVDAGFAGGNVIGPHYDSLLAKLIAWGTTRDEALRKGRRMLRDAFVTGLATNLPLLRKILAHPQFVAGTYTTHLLDDGALNNEELEGGSTVPAALAEEVLAAVAAVHAVEMSVDSQRRMGAGSPRPWASIDSSIDASNRGSGTAMASPWSRHAGWRGGVAPTGVRRCRVRWGTESHQVTYRHDAAGILVEALESTQRTRLIPHRSSNNSLGGSGILDLGNLRLPLRWDYAPTGPAEATLWLQLRGTLLNLTVGDGAVSSAGTRDADARETLCAPLPGKVIEVATATGATVAPGTLLMVVEAMKMEHRIVAPFAGKVAALHYAEGDRVDKGDLLLDLQPPD